MSKGNQFFIFCPTKKKPKFAFQLHLFLKKRLLVVGRLVALGGGEGSVISAVMKVPPNTSSLLSLLPHTANKQSERQHVCDVYFSSNAGRSRRAPLNLTLKEQLFDLAVSPVLHDFSPVTCSWSL